MDTPAEETEQRRVVRVAADLAALEAGLRARTAPLPARLPQQTFPEARRAAMALADGPSGDRWEWCAGEAYFIHQIPDETLPHARLDLSAGWDEPRLRAALRDGGLDAVLLLHVALGAVLASPGPVTVALDELIAAAGLRYHGREERQAQRRRVADCLHLIGALSIWGKRWGTYRDREHTRLDLSIQEPLLQVGEMTGAPEAPAAVTLDATQWLTRFRGNRSVLSFFGDVRGLAALPSRQVSGVWARSIGLALQQRWREQATSARRQTAPDGSVRLRFRPFTRRHLLSLFRPDPPVEAVLAGEHPGRAVQYWDEAIRLLFQHELLLELPRPAAPGRRPQIDWRSAWLEEAIEFAPRGDGAAGVEEVAAAARARPRRGERAS